MSTLLVLQAERQRVRGEKDRNLLERRAQYLEKTKNIMVFEPMQEESRKGRGRVSVWFLRGKVVGSSSNNREHANTGRWCQRQINDKS